MTQEEKSLLFKDLCCRLPYRVNMWHMTNVWADYKFVRKNVSTEQLTKDNITKIDDNFKPYLRPLSSMTEDERKEYNDIVKNTIDFYDCPKSEEVCPFVIPIDWLNKKMFDYRGLIEKGLALEAPENMYVL